MKLNDSEKFLIHEKTLLALLFIYRKEVTYISEVSANIDSTFSHTNKIIKRLEEMGYISSLFEGRTRFLQLTPKGYYYTKQLEAAFEICRSDETFEFPEGYVPTRQEDPGENIAETEQSTPSIHSENQSDSGSEKSRPIETHTLAGRIQLFCHRIQEIYEEQTEAEADTESFLQKLGPYDRELKMIGREIEKLEPSEPSAFVLTSAYRAAEMQYKFYLGKE